MSLHRNYLTLKIITVLLAGNWLTLSIIIALLVDDGRWLLASPLWALNTVLAVIDALIYWRMIELRTDKGG